MPLKVNVGLSIFIRPARSSRIQRCHRVNASRPKTRNHGALHGVRIEVQPDGTHRESPRLARWAAARRSYSASSAAISASISSRLAW